VHFNFSRRPTPPPFGRRQTFLRGAIYISGDAPMPCAVRDLYPTGARLFIPSSSPLPSQFRLKIEARGFEAHCALVERSGDAAEVCFVRPVERKAPGCRR
jgi:hypothetical protein